jgi:hypothetical protein
MKKERGILVLAREFCVRAKFLNFSRNIFKFMKIFRAIGLGLAIVIIGNLMPEVFQGFENTLLKFFEFLSEVFSIGTNNISNIGSIHNPNLIPQLLPVR